jgi:hypothetical protein
MTTKLPRIDDRLEKDMKRVFRGSFRNRPGLTACRSVRHSAGGSCERAFPLAQCFRDVFGQPCVFSGRPARGRAQWLSARARSHVVPVSHWLLIY